jgi:2-C-methyl-D-erythritol 4-phosphate cytidylyltransferase
VRIWAVVVAGGRGQRYGKPKQFEFLGRRTVLEWSVQAARSVAEGVVVVLPEGMPLDPGGGDVAVHGGPTRSGSVRAGLAAVPPQAEVVVVHDAARPLAGEELFRAVVEALSDPDVDGVVPVLPVTDTVKRVAAGRVLETVPRQDLVVVQTPQAFRITALVDAHRDGVEGTDDAALVELRGGRVVTVPGDPANLKITSPNDMALAETLLRRR